MTKTPKTPSLFHLVGIGGIGMSALAQLLLHKGYRVQGSDVTENAQTRLLRARGIPVFGGHAPAHVTDDVNRVVCSSAVHKDNSEIQAARQRGIPVTYRGKVLAELSKGQNIIGVAGTHGKTTCTALIGTLLDVSGMAPTIVNGGVMTRYGSNVHFGTSPWYVIEADESDGSFLHLAPQIALVTNINPDHLDHYGTYASLQNAFATFMQSIPSDGAIIACQDDPMLSRLLPKNTNHRIITYGQTEHADLQCLNIRPGFPCITFDLRLRPSGKTEETIFKDIALSALGIHNVVNACGAVATALHLGAHEKDIREGLSCFQGVERRLTHVSTWRGMSVYDDYAHHPTEICAVLAALRPVVQGQLIVVFQPHRYSRLKSLFDAFCTCFSLADRLLVAPVYSAGETPTPECPTHDHLARALQTRMEKKARAIACESDVQTFLMQHAHRGDGVVFLGAGNVTQWARALV